MALQIIHDAWRMLWGLFNGLHPQADTLTHLPQQRALLEKVALKVAQLFCFTMLVLTFLYRYLVGGD